MQTGSPVESAVPSIEAAAETLPESAATALPPQPRVHEVVLLYSARDAGDAAVAAAIRARLQSSRYRVTEVDIESSEARARPAGSAAVAVGREAAAFARERLPDLPLVLCQVFNYHALVAGQARVWGVSALPPLRLQLRGWKAADPSLERIGMIVSEAHAELEIDLRAAARAIGAEVTVARSASDRETLYLFKRMAAGIDGFWLLPDSGILSPGVLRELLDYALSHDVGVLVSSDALLSWGALLSARSLPADVAASVHGVLERVVEGRTERLARMSPLSQVALTFNPVAVRRLGLANAPDARWVLREPD